jgi:hypothetical protein
VKGSTLSFKLSQVVTAFPARATKGVDAMVLVGSCVVQAETMQRGLAFFRVPFLNRKNVTGEA